MDVEQKDKNLDTSTEPINIAYIDEANLDKALKLTLGWKLDYARFRIWLSEKYDVKRAYIFIGMIPKYKDLYTYFQECGFTLIFKEVVYKNGVTPKGNCDSDLIMQATEDYYAKDLRKAIIVASDGDYAPLLKMLAKNNSLEVVISPSPAKKCSILIKRIGCAISYLNEKRSILEKRKEKAPNTDGTV